jgi:hypothetical protein
MASPLPPLRGDPATPPLFFHHRPTNKNPLGRSQKPVEPSKLQLPYHFTFNASKAFCRAIFIYFKECRITHEKSTTIKCHKCHSKEMPLPPKTKTRGSKSNHAHPNLRNLQDQRSEAWRCLDYPSPLLPDFPHL